MLLSSHAHFTRLDSQKHESTLKKCLNVISSFPPTSNVGTRFQFTDNKACQTLVYDDFKLYSISVHCGHAGIELLINQLKAVSVTRIESAL